MLRFAILLAYVIILYEIVFSATGRTQKVVDSISPIFAKEKIKIDLSELNAENKICNLSKDSFCIVAVPVYCNRAIDNCLLESKNILTECPRNARALPTALISFVSVAMKSKFKGRKENTLYI